MKKSAPQNPESDPNAPDETYIQAALKDRLSKIWQTSVAQASDAQLKRAHAAAGTNDVLRQDLAAALRERGIKSPAAPSGAPTSEHDPAVADGTLSTEIVTEDTLLGQQLTAQHEKVKSALREQLIFGAMIMKVAARFDSTVESKPSHAGRGRYAGGSGLKGWLAQYAPTVAEPTAYRYMALAKGLHDEFKLGKKADLTLLLSAPDEELSDSLRKKQRDILEMLDGKSQRQLKLELGLAPAKETGGKREKTGPEATLEEKHQRAIEALQEKFRETFVGVKYRTSDGVYKLMTDAEVETAIDHAREFQEEATAWLKLTRAERQSQAAAAFRD